MKVAIKDGRNILVDYMMTNITASTATNIISAVSDLNLCIYKSFVLYIILSIFTWLAPAHSSDNSKYHFLKKKEILQCLITWMEAESIFLIENLILTQTLTANH